MVFRSNISYSVAVHVEQVDLWSPLLLGDLSKKDYIKKAVRKDAKKVYITLIFMYTNHILSVLYFQRYHVAPWQST